MFAAIMSDVPDSQLLEPIPPVRTSLEQNRRSTSRRPSWLVAVSSLPSGGRG